MFAQGKMLAVIHMNFQFEINRLIEAYSKDQQPIVQFRLYKLNAIKEHFKERGHPQRITLNHLSLLPAYFQEAIYDGIDWWKQNTSLQQLKIEFELDCMFQNEGKMREELSPREFEEYADFSSKAINGA